MATMAEVAASLRTELDARNCPADVVNVRYLIMGTRVSIYETGQNWTIGQTRLQLMLTHVLALPLDATRPQVYAAIQNSNPAVAGPEEA